MKNYIVLGLIILSSCCSKEEPKSRVYRYHYGEKVGVIDGFYEGCTGTVTEYIGTFDDGQWYDLALECRGKPTNAKLGERNFK